MLDLNVLLTLAGLDPAQVLVVRHVPVEKPLRKVLPWLAVDRPDLFLAYQRVQWTTLEKAMTKGKYIASFIGQEPVTATFAGLYRIGSWQTLDYDGYQAFPGNAELEALGMTGRNPTSGDCLAFDLEKLEPYTDWAGRLMITWPKPYRQWWRWAGKGSFPVNAITLDNRFVREMPDWSELVLTWAQLQTLPPSWRSALSQWRGIYYIYDERRAAGYVGSASGDENILGRWRDYARSGHGGNRLLRASDFNDLRFSILQRTSPDLDVQHVVTLEASWKARLHTRNFGLNAN